MAYSQTSSGRSACFRAREGERAGGSLMSVCFSVGLFCSSGRDDRLRSSQTWWRHLSRSRTPTSSPRWVGSHTCPNARHKVFCKATKPTRGWDSIISIGSRCALWSTHEYSKSQANNWWTCFHLKGSHVGLFDTFDATHRRRHRVIFGNFLEADSGSVSGPFAPSPLLPPFIEILCKADPAISRESAFDAIHDTQAFIVANDELILVVFRGTRESVDWVTNLNLRLKATPVEWKLDNGCHLHKVSVSVACAPQGCPYPFNG